MARNPAIRSSGSRQESERYYLLPGMGGRARRQKVRQMVLWGTLGGLMTSLVMVGILYFIHHFSKGAW